MDGQLTVDQDSSTIAVERDGIRADVPMNISRNLVCGLVCYITLSQYATIFTR